MYQGRYRAATQFDSGADVMMAQHHTGRGGQLAGYADEGVLGRGVAVARGEVGGPLDVGVVVGAAHGNTDQLDPQLGENIEEGNRLGWEWMGHGETNSVRLSDYDTDEEAAAQRSGAKTPKKKTA